MVPWTQVINTYELIDSLKNLLMFSSNQQRIKTLKKYFSPFYQEKYRICYSRNIQLFWVLIQFLGKLWTLWATEKHSHLAFIFTLTFCLAKSQLDIKGSKVGIYTENKFICCILVSLKQKNIFWIRKVLCLVYKCYFYQQLASFQNCYPQ